MADNQFSFHTSLYPNDSVTVRPRYGNSVSEISLLTREESGEGTVIILTNEEAENLATALQFYARGMHRE